MDAGVAGVLSAVFTVLCAVIGTIVASYGFVGHELAGLGIGAVIGLVFGAISYEISTS